MSFRRHVALWLTLPCLALASLVPLLASPPAQAAGCTDETNNGITGCDDTDPPVVSLTVAQDSGAGTVGLTFAGRYDDDEDPAAFPIDLECQLDGAAYAPCQSPMTLSNLAGGSTHTVSVEAIDRVNQAIAACNDLCAGYTESAPDIGVARTTFTVGAPTSTTSSDGSPQTTIDQAPADRLTPTTPVSLSSTPRVVINSSQPGTVRCAVDARPYKCHLGPNLLRHLSAGSHVFVAQAVNRAGQPDLSPASVAFYLPLNLSHDDGWRLVKASGYYHRDYLLTTHRGATITLPKVRHVSEIRLIAPSGPKLGVVKIKVGHFGWQRVSLKAVRADATKEQVFVVRAPGASPESGVVKIKAASIPHGGGVAVDALVLR